MRKQYYVVETVDGIAINVVACEDDPKDARVVFEGLAREHMTDDGFDVDQDELDECVADGIYANGDYTLSIVVKE